MSGKTLRLKRFQSSPNGRMVILPLDHGVSCGPLRGLERPENVIRMGVQEGADALVLHKGMLRCLESLPGQMPGIILHLSASSQLGPAVHHKVLIGTVAEAIRCGADAVSIHINLGNSKEPEMLQDFGAVSDACTEWQVPLLAMMYVRGLDEAATAPDATIAHAARIAAELGADLIKIPAPDDDHVLTEITSSLPVPVVIAGGSKIAETPVFLERVERAMAAGAHGVAMGRNVFQDEYPQLLLRATCRIVHRGYSARKAWEEYKMEVVGAFFHPRIDTNGHE
jgi:predicted phospho-2-dehydro-3-deoxyheptonate aldolase